MTAIQDRVEELRTQLVAWRRHLHMNPEVGFEEHETSAKTAVNNTSVEVVVFISRSSGTRR